MPITDLQAIQRIIKPASQAELQRAAEDNDRQRFHALTATSKEDAGAYVAKFESWIERMLNNEEKFKRFKELMIYPVSTTRLIDKAADQYLKAFDAEDKYLSMEFTSDGLEADALEYFKLIDFEGFKRNDLFQQCLQASGSIWVADLPAQPNESGYAEPRPLLREFGQLTDIGVTKQGVILYVIYALDSIKNEEGTEVEKRWAVIDDASFRVVKKANSDTSHSVLFTNPHQLGRTPAGFIWHDRLIQDKPLRIQGPLHALFSDLDHFAKDYVMRKDADLYASYPIFRSYKSRCNYETPDGHQCQNGKIAVPKEDNDKEHTIIDCPMCSKEKPIGPGTHIKTPPPADATSPDLTNPAGFINAQRDLLDYNAEKEEVTAESILEALTGDDGTTDQSTNPQNQDQVAARFEKRKGILSYWAGHLETTDEEMTWVLLALRYGQQFLTNSASYGSEFHLLTPGQAIADYDAARKAGLPTYQLMARRRRIDKVLAGASELETLRTYILERLEPYPDLSLDKVAVGSDAYELKANFSHYIDRFEMENISLEVFGKTLAMAAKISTIKEILYKYVEEEKPRREVPVVAGEGQERKPVPGKG